MITRNVHRALPEGCHLIKTFGEQRSSRNGSVLVYPGVFVTIYTSPRERVVFHAERDANPFFHLMESLWMLAGRDDVPWISEFNGNIATFSDFGSRFHGAYGFRWSRRFRMDQPGMIAEALRDNPECRRQVLQIWDARCDLGSNSKDLPCNTQAYFQRDGEGRLDMMVCNRSNDMIWGAYGANAVHFSVLQEYVAAWIGCPVGRYTQVSMNTHVYERHWDMADALAAKAHDPTLGHPPSCPYSRGLSPMALMDENMMAWGQDLAEFMDDRARTYRTEAFERLEIVRQAWRAFKRKDDKDRHMAALELLGELPDCDWRTACIEWVLRRMK